MNSWLYKVAAALLAAAIVPSASAQSLTARAITEPEKPAAGEPFALVVSIEGSSNASGRIVAGSPTVQWPDFGLLGLERLSGSSSSTGIVSVNGQTRVVNKAEIRLIAPRPGRYEIPPITVIESGTTYTTQALTIDVTNARSHGGRDPGATAPRVPGIGLPLRSPAAGSWVRTVAVATTVALVTVGIIAAVVVVGLRMRQRDKDAVEEPPGRPDPVDQAYARLRRLSEQADARPFYSALDAWLRRSLCRCYGIEAAGLTSEELLAACREARPSENASLDAAAECLRASDRVKFAAYGPTAEEMQRHLALAWGVVHRCGAQSRHGGDESAAQVL